MLAACQSSEGGGDPAAEKPYVESDECRSLAADAVADVEAIDDETADDGSARMNYLTKVHWGGDPEDNSKDGPMQNYGTRNRDVAMKCSREVVQAYWDAEAKFTEANLMWGNECFPAGRTAACDEQAMRESLLNGIELGHEFIDAVNRRGTQAEADVARVSPGTINLVGSLRLYEDVKRAPDGEGGQFCYGGRIYDVGYDYPVAVTDAAGTDVALGTVDEGQVVNSLCVFNFIVEDVPDEAGVYSMTIGDFDAGQFTIKEYKRQPLGFQLTLGFDG